MNASPYARCVPLVFQMTFIIEAVKDDHRLSEIMKRIHERCVEYGRRPDGRVNYVDGANRAGFAKVADAMLANGAI